MPKILLICFIFSFTKSFGQTFSPIELRADLAFLKERIEEIHPNPYKFTTQNRFQQIYDSLYKVERPLAVKQTFIHFLSLTRAIQCGHTSILVDERLIKPNNVNPKFLPMDVSIFGEKVYVSRNLSENNLLVKGTEITVIEDIPIPKLLKNLSKYTFQNGDGRNADVDSYYLQRNFRRLLYLFFDEQDELHLRVKLNNEEQNLSVKTQPLAYLREMEAERNPIRNTDFYKNIYLSENNAKTSVLRIRSFDGNEFENGNFHNEIFSIFKKITEKQSKNLIIDVRNNAGGGLDYADEILKYLLSKPFTKYQISSNPNIKDKKKALSVNRFYEPANDFQFRGNVFVLVNEGTFSTAVYLAAHLKSQENVSLIGTTCGGAADGSSAGKFTSFTLPNTKFTVSLPLLKINYNATNELYLKPKHEVRQSYADFLAGEDTPFEFAKKIIKSTNTD
jgi:Peptidase family S41